MQLSQEPVYIFWKDINSFFLGCNSSFAKIAGLDHPDQIRGKTDYDLPWRDTQATAYREGDQAVLNGALSVNVVESQLQANGINTRVLLNKLPLTDAQGQKIGVIGTYTEISTIHDPKKCINQFTNRQYDCLILLVKGWTSKEIAKSLGLSPRTIEHYIDTIKSKLQCRTRSSLIAKALQLDGVKKDVYS